MKITEEEIRPENIFNEYLKLTAIDTKTYFENALKFDINCPPCECGGDFWALKKGFNYNLCPNCQTIYVSPRPEIEAFKLLNNNPNNFFRLIHF